LILRPGISLENLLYFFPSTILILFFATALGLSLSAINVFLRDTQYLVDVALMVLIWASPIMYSWSMAKNIISNDFAVFIYTSNPITLAVMGYQKAFWESDISPTGTFPDNLWIFLWVSAFVSLILIFISQRVFLKLQGNFAQVL
jgi:ABC-2 type transport system permease protein